MLCGSRGSLDSALREASGLRRGGLISTVFVGSVLGDTLGSGGILVCKRAPPRASPGPVRWGLRAFPRSSDVPTIAAAAAARPLESELPDMLIIRPPRLCVKFGDGTAAGPGRAPSPGVLRPPLGTPLPENSWTGAKAAALALNSSCCGRCLTATEPGCPGVAMRSGTAISLLGCPVASRNWTDGSACLPVLRWGFLADASSVNLVWTDLRTSAGGWSWLKLFWVVRKSRVRPLFWAGNRYCAPVLSKLYTWPLFSHWTRCLHGPTRVRRCCWPAAKQENSRKTRIRELPMARWWGAGAELQRWQRNQQQLSGTSGVTGGCFKHVHLRHGAAHTIQTWWWPNEWFHSTARIPKVTTDYPSLGYLMIR